MTYSEGTKSFAPHRKHKYTPRTESKTGVAARPGGTENLEFGVLLQPLQLCCPWEGWGEGTMCLWEAFCLLKMPLQIQRELSACSQISGTRNCLVIFQQTEICLCTPPSHSNSFLLPHLLMLPLPCGSSRAACSAASTVCHPKRKGENSSGLPRELVRSGVLALCEQTLHKLNFNSRKILPSTFFFCLFVWLVCFVLILNAPNPGF